MNRTKLSNSSTLQSIGFDAETKVLQMEFKPSKKSVEKDPEAIGPLYDYSNCTEDEFQQILLADKNNESPGRKFKELIQDTKKEYKKVIMQE